MNKDVSTHARKRRRTLWIMTIAGFVLPNVLFGKFFADNGLSRASGIKAVREASGTLPAAAILVDAGLTANTFLTWAAWDSRKHNVRGWWLAYPATFGVGICFGAPLYLLLREYAVGDA